MNVRVWFIGSTGLLGYYWGVNSQPSYPLLNYLPVLLNYQSIQYFYGGRMKPMLNLLNDGVSVHFAYRGYDQYVGKIVAPLFIERLDESEKISICVDFEELKRRMDSRQRQIILPDIDYPDSGIRIVRRLRYLFEDGNSLHYTELTLRKDNVIKQAYVSENLFAFELGAMELNIAGRIPTVA